MKQPILSRNKSQVDCVLEYMKGGKSITPLKARHLFGVERLADVIYKIKRRYPSVKVVTELMTDENNKTYAEYNLSSN